MLAHLSNGSRRLLQSYRLKEVTKVIFRLECLYQCNGSAFIMCRDICLEMTKPQRVAEVNRRWQSSRSAETCTSCSVSLDNVCIITRSDISPRLTVKQTGETICNFDIYFKRHSHRVGLFCTSTRTWKSWPVCSWASMADPQTGSWWTLLLNWSQQLVDCGPSICSALWIVTPPRNGGWLARSPLPSPSAPLPSTVLFNSPEAHEIKFAHSSELCPCWYF